MSDETFTKADLDAAVAAALASASARVAGLTRICAGFGLDSADLSAAIASGVTVEAFALDRSDAAAKVRKDAAEKSAADSAAAAAVAKPDTAAAAAALAALAADEAAAAAAAATGGESGGDTVDAIAARIAAA